MIFIREALSNAFTSHLEANGWLFIFFFGFAGKSPKSLYLCTNDNDFSG